MFRHILFTLLSITARVVMAPVPAADVAPLANGVFLVAKPELFDPNFRETVVLITQPVPGGGPLGVILNRPSEARLSEAWPDAGAVPEQFDTLYGGGPVGRNRLLFLIRSNERIEKGLRVLDDVYLSGDPALLKNIVAAEIKVKAVRAYAGYAGWAPRQLQAEIAAGGWYVIPDDADTIFTADVATMWPALIKRITLRSTRFVPPVRESELIPESVAASGLLEPISKIQKRQSSADKLRYTQMNVQGRLVAGVK